MSGECNISLLERTDIENKPLMANTLYVRALWKICIDDVSNVSNVRERSMHTVAIIVFPVPGGPYRRTPFDALRRGELKSSGLLSGSRTLRSYRRAQNVFLITSSMNDAHIIPEKQGKEICKKWSRERRWFARQHHGQAPSSITTSSASLS